MASNGFSLNASFYRTYPIWFISLLTTLLIWLLFTPGLFFLSYFFFSFSRSISMKLRLFPREDRLKMASCFLPVSLVFKNSAKCFLFNACAYCLWSILSSIKGESYFALESLLLPMGVLFGAQNTLGFGFESFIEILKQTWIVLDLVLVFYPQSNSFSLLVGLIFPLLQL